MKRILFCLLVIVSLPLLTFCKNRKPDKSYTFAFHIIINKTETSLDKEFKYTSSGSYSPSDDDVEEIIVQLNEGRLQIGDDVFKGKIHRFPRDNSIEFFLETENSKDKQIELLKSLKSKSLIFSIPGNSGLQNLNVENVSEYDFQDAYWLNCFMEIPFSFKDYNFNDSEFKIDVGKDKNFE